MQCLHRMRQTLHPGVAEGEVLPRRIQQPLHQLLELHSFITTCTPPTATQRGPSPARSCCVLCRIVGHNLLTP